MNELKSIYELSKTYKVGLKPIGDTAFTIGKLNMIAEAQKRNDSYVYARSVINQHCSHLAKEAYQKAESIIQDSALSQDLLSISEACINQTKKERPKTIQAMIKKLITGSDTAKNVLSALGEYNHRMTYREAFSSLKKDDGEGWAITVDEASKIDGVYSDHQGFFDKLITNKKVTFGKSKLSIYYRIVNDNALIYIANLLVVNDVKTVLLESDAENCKALDAIDGFLYGEIIDSKFADYNLTVSNINLALNNLKQNKVIGSYQKLRKLKKQYMQGLEFSPNKYTIGDAGAIVTNNINQLIDALDKATAIIRNNNHCDLDSMIDKTMLNSLSSVWLKNHNAINEALDFVGKSAKSLKALKLADVEAIVFDDLSYRDVKKDVLPLSDFIGSHFQHLIATAKSRLPSAKSAAVAFAAGKATEDDKAFMQEFCDSVNDISRFSRIFSLHKLDEIDREAGDLNDVSDLIGDLCIHFHYNTVRNTVLRKLSSVKPQVALDLDEATSFLGGWDVAKESANRSIILKRCNQYYLGILNDTKALDYIADESQSDAVKARKEELADEILAKDGEQYYLKRVSKQVNEPRKMLPKIFFAKSYLDVLEGVKGKDYIQSITAIKADEKYKAGSGPELTAMINHYREGLINHETYAKYFDFKQLKEADEYSSYDEFVSDALRLWTFVRFDKIKASYIDGLVKSGKLLLFRFKHRHLNQCRTFANSDTRRSKVVNRSAQMIYEAIEGIGDTRLNGGANMLWRDVVIPPKKAFSHKVGEVMRYRTKPSDGRCFDKEIVKDKRYTEEAFYLTLPISINASKKEARIMYDDFNAIINKEYWKGDQTKYLSISFGVSNMLSYALVKGDGSVIEADTINVIDGYDYAERLREIESGNATKQRKWQSLDSAAKIKLGYIGKAINHLMKIIREHNCYVLIPTLSDIDIKRLRGFDRFIYEQFVTLFYQGLCYDRVTRKQYVPLIESKKNMAFQRGICIFANTYGVIGDPNVVRETMSYDNATPMKLLTYKNKSQFAKDIKARIESIVKLGGEFIVKDDRGVEFTSKVQRNDREGNKVDLSDLFNNAFVGSGVDVEDGAELKQRLLNRMSKSSVKSLTDLCSAINLLSMFVGYDNANQTKYFASAIRSSRFTTSDRNSLSLMNADQVKAYNMWIKATTNEYIGLGR